MTDYDELQNNINNQSTHTGKTAAISNQNNTQQSIPNQIARPTVTLQQYIRETGEKALSDQGTDQGKCLVKIKPFTTVAENRQTMS